MSIRASAQRAQCFDLFIAPIIPGRFRFVAIVPAWTRTAYGRLVLYYLVDYMYINLTNAEKHAIACLDSAEEPTRATSKIIKILCGPTWDPGLLEIMGYQRYGLRET